jgi:hypothetical protein
MRRLTETEAIEMLQVLWDTSPEMYSQTCVEATIGDKDAADARSEIKAYIEAFDDDIDPHGIIVTEDVVEGSDMPCATVTIMIGGSE